MKMQAIESGRKMMLSEDYTFTFLNEPNRITSIVDMFFKVVLIYHLR